VKKIFIAKERPLFDPLIVHILPTASSELARLGLIDPTRMSERALQKFDHMQQEFWPGPLTVLLPKGPLIPDLVTAGSDFVALRAPSHPVFQDVLQTFGSPLAAPSANRFGHVSPTTAQHVFDDLAGRIPLIVDGGDARIGVESTIVRLLPDGFELLRPGGLASARIAAILGPQHAKAAMTDRQTLDAPGLLAKHYAPEKPVVLFQPGEDLPPFMQGTAILPAANSNALDSLSAAVRSKLKIESLSQSGSDLEAARKIYSILRAVELDSACEICVIVLPESHDGLWPAIRDRLQRASAK
jgi:L-threonylcarbamoyladenylate synthase